MTLKGAQCDISTAVLRCHHRTKPVQEDLKRTWRTLVTVAPVAVPTVRFKDVLRRFTQQFSHKGLRLRKGKQWTEGRDKSREWYRLKIIMSFLFKEITKTALPNAPSTLIPHGLNVCLPPAHTRQAILSPRPSLSGWTKRKRIAGESRMKTGPQWGSFAHG